MTSRDSPRECYVYITLPRETEFVVAARFTLAIDRQGIPMGKFAYGRSYLERENAVPIDPFELKLSNKTYTTTILNGVFGALRDASPDHWGRSIIDKHAGRAPLGEMDYLLYSLDDRAGALGFGSNREPPGPRRKFNRTMDLERLQKFADAILADEDLPEGPDSEQAQDLMLAGTSMGGARPKAVVEDGAGLWIAKFNRPDDKWNHARVEQAMLALARECGLRVSESKVTTIGGRDVEELRRLSSQPRIDGPELFRRMCFNALISNTDDHPRNHAVIAMDTEWKLSPAYDLIPSMPVSIERRDLALICGDMGRRARADNLLSQSARFLLGADDAEKIVDEMEQTVRDSWYDIARREGVTEKDCAKITSAFAYPGFRLTIME